MQPLLLSLLLFLLFLLQETPSCPSLCEVCHQHTAHSADALANPNNIHIVNRVFSQANPSYAIEDKTDKCNSESADNS